jgi:tRNA threonylcarbamoyladenosine biosynthesis protein TsaB
MMNILAIDTSTPIASIAIAINEQIVAESLINTNRTLSSRLIPEIERLLATAGLTIADIDLFASSLGPGSFTGVRGGIATIQGLALALDKTCTGFSSLALLAMNLPLSKTFVCPILDARKNEVYAALYDCSSDIPTSCINDSVLSITDLLNKIATFTEEPVIFVGDGTVRYRDEIAERLGPLAIFAPFTLNVPHASNGIMLALLAFKHNKLSTPAQLLPAYLRASDAELVKLKKAISDKDICD